MICEELEKMDILISLPDDQELESQFEQNGYIEIKVSASAYSQLHDLASSVEFNYQQTAAEKRLSIGGMILSFGCGLLLPFGALVFLKLFGSDKKNGYIRRADEGAFWFGVGVVAWVFAILALYTALANNHNR